MKTDSLGIAIPQVPIIETRPLEIVRSEIRFQKKIGFRPVNEGAGRIINVGGKYINVRDLD